MSALESVYSRLPVWAQHTAVSAYGAYWRWLRFGPGFAGHLRGYEDRERFTASDWKEWQTRSLLKLLRDSAAHAPYYRDRWSPEQKAAAAAGWLEDLPILEKDSVRAEPEAFLRADLTPRRTLTYHTSGTTGTPIRTHWLVQEIRSSIALREARSARWAGVGFSLPRATFSGRLVEPDPGSRGPFHRFNIFERQAYLSPFHLRADTAPLYVEALRRHGIQWLTGYAVSYSNLAGYILEQKLKVPPLKAVITTSEKVTPEMRRVMEAAYGCRVYEEYSTVESALFASECGHGRLHVSPDVAVVEILRPDGSPCAPGEVGEVVTTCLLRRYQPFIRFRLGDLAAWDPEPCPCGRAMPVLKEVVGRLEDMVTGPDGRKLVRFHGIFTDQPRVREGQIVQEALDRIRVKVVGTDQFGPEDEREIVRRVRQRLGSGIAVVVEQTAHIPRTPAGKFRAVVSLMGSPS